MHELNLRLKYAIRPSAYKTKIIILNILNYKKMIYLTVNYAIHVKYVCINKNHYSEHEYYKTMIYLTVNYAIHVKYVRINKNHYSEHNELQKDDISNCKLYNSCKVCLYKEKSLF